MNLSINEAIAAYRLANPDFDFSKDRVRQAILKGAKNPPRKENGVFEFAYAHLEAGASILGINAPTTMQFLQAQGYEKVSAAIACDPPIPLVRVSEAGDRSLRAIFGFGCPTADLEQLDSDDVELHYVLEEVGRDNWAFALIENCGCTAGCLESLTEFAEILRGIEAQLERHLDDIAPNEHGVFDEFEEEDVWMSLFNEILDKDLVHDDGSPASVAQQALTGLFTYHVRLRSPRHISAYRQVKIEREIAERIATAIRPAVEAFL